jgi:hypothetical protein
MLDMSAPPPIHEVHLSSLDSEGISNTTEEVMFPKGKSAELQTHLEKSLDKNFVGKNVYTPVFREQY